MILMKKYIILYLIYSSSVAVNAAKKYNVLLINSDDLTSTK